MKFEVYLYKQYEPMDTVVEAETLEELKEKVCRLSDDFYLNAFVDFVDMAVYLGDLEWCDFYFHDRKARALEVKDEERNTNMYDVSVYNGNVEESFNVNTLEDMKKAMVGLTLKYHAQSLVDFYAEQVYVGFFDWKDLGWFVL